MPIYQEYARLYDRSGQLGFSMRMLRYISQLLEAFPVHGNRLLDLACGTGTFAIGMGLDGWQVQGVDGSASMLEQAQAKTPDTINVTWSLQDMRSFSANEPVHLVTCLYDSLNYMLTDDDLVAVFRHALAALLPNGLFIFDMNTPWVLANQWDDSTYMSESNDLTSIMHSTYDDRMQRATVTVTCFERQGELYRKTREQHTEQAYPLEQVSNDLVLVGFRLEAMYRCFTFQPASDNDPRAIWIARKPAIDGRLHL